MFVYKVGVLGAGTMGAEIAQICAWSGLPVVLKDLNQELVEKGIARARSIFQGRVDKGKMSVEQMEQAMSNITPVTTYDEFKDVDVVIEVVKEDMAVKKAVLKELDAICQPSCIFASNTSALSISEMAAATSRPSKVVGMHFFFPAHVMKLVEVIPGLDTSEDTVQTIVELSERLRKIPIKVKEIPAFLVNRILIPQLNEAIACLDENVASARDIDIAMQAGAGMPMGPFTLADNLGLDVCLAVMEYMYKEYADAKYAPHPLLKKMVRAGRLGVKSGKGFYEYS